LNDTHPTLQGTMNLIAERAAAALRQHPHPALRLDELLTLVADRLDRNLTRERLRAILEDHPGEFRIIGASVGTWDTSPECDAMTRRCGPWVLSIAPEPGGTEPPHPVPALRESVRWVGRTIDGRSRMDIGRWDGLAMSERATMRALQRRAS
jgi:hypothetical protein